MCFGDEVFLLRVVIYFYLKISRKCSKIAVLLLTYHMDYYFDAFRKYAQFDGRTPRKGFWMFMLFHVIVVIILSIIDGMLKLDIGQFGMLKWDIGQNQGLLGATYSLAIIVPGIAIGVRRMHDIDRNGWWILLPIVNFIFTLLAGTPGENTYGLPDKGPIKV